MGVRAIVCIAALAASVAAGADEMVLSDFESLANWEGLVADTGIVHEGEQSGLWANVPEQTSVSYRGVRDWSQYRGLSVWIHN
ncbi:MAG: hypothetical protein ACQER1_12990, partial [Armatimonadota bacterium]